MRSYQSVIHFSPETPPPRIQTSLIDVGPEVTKSPKKEEIKKVEEEISHSTKRTNQNSKKRGKEENRGKSKRKLHRRTTTTDPYRFYADSDPRSQAFKKKHNKTSKKPRKIYKKYVATPNSRPTLGSFQFYFDWDPRSHRYKPILDDSPKLPKTIVVPKLGNIQESGI